MLFGFLTDAQVIAQYEEADTYFTLNTQRELQYVVVVTLSLMRKTIVRQCKEMYAGVTQMICVRICSN